LTPICSIPIDSTSLRRVCERAVENYFAVGKFNVDRADVPLFCARVRASAPCHVAFRAHRESTRMPMKYRLSRRRNFRWRNRERIGANAAWSSLGKICAR
jgi:hypothetical protein